MAKLNRQDKMKNEVHNFLAELPLNKKFSFSEIIDQIRTKGHGFKAEWIYDVLGTLSEGIFKYSVMDNPTKRDNRNSYKKGKEKFHFLERHGSFSLKDTSKTRSKKVKKAKIHSIEKTKEWVGKIVTLNGYGIFYVNKTTQGIVTGKTGNVIEVQMKSKSVPLYFKYFNVKSGYELDREHGGFKLAL